MQKDHKMNHTHNDDNENMRIKVMYNHKVIYEKVTLQEWQNNRIADRLFSKHTKLLKYRQRLVHF